MSASHKSSLLAVDVGNSRVKLGWFPPETPRTSEAKPSGLPIESSELIMPEESFAVSHADASQDDFTAQISSWLDQLPTQDIHCYLASVHAGSTKAVAELLAGRFPHKLVLLSASWLPLEVRIDEPDGVGIDRLLCALAANRLREKVRPAIVVSAGTACTVNLIAADGAFEGGAILPGIALSADALYRGTSALPHLSSEAINPAADAVGKSTPAAISSGITWGLLGAVHELIRRMTHRLDQSPQLFVTGGEAPRLAKHLVGPDGPACHVPNLVLAGIRLAAGAMQ